MLQEEFEKLTRIYPDMWLYDEINKSYNASNLDKDVWCKNYKANKDGMAEGIAKRTSERQWKVDAENKKLGMRIALLEAEIANRNETINYLREAAHNDKEEANKRIVQLNNVNTDRVKEIAELNEKLEAKDLEIMRLKAKLYDLMVKDNGAA